MASKKNKWRKRGRLEFRRETKRFSDGSPWSPPCDVLYIRVRKVACAVVEPFIWGDAAPLKTLSVLTGTYRAARPAEAARIVRDYLVTYRPPVRRKLKTDSFVAPSWLAPALINGDESGIDNPEDARALRWLLAWIRWSYGPRASVVDCDDEGFRWDCWPLIRAPRRLVIPSMRLGGDAARYTVLYSERA